MNSPTFKQPKPATINSSCQIIHLKQHKKIRPILRNNAKWRCLMPSDITYINKYKPKMLSAVELKSLRCQEINGIRNLCRALTDTKRVSSLTITDQDYYYENLRELHHLLNITNRWKKLNLRFMNSQDDEEEEGSESQDRLKSMIRLRKCKDLSSLKISFDCHYQTKRIILKSLSKQVQGLPKLKNLNIDISGCYQQEDYGDDDDDENVHDHDDTNSPVFTFKYPRSLSFLRLDFEEADSIDPELVPKFASNLQRCHLLDNVLLNFCRLTYHMEISETQIWKSLAEKISSIKTFTINKTLTDYEFELNQNYLDSFEHLKTVEKMNIDLYLNLKEFSNQVLPAILFAQLASLTNLKSLNLAMGCPYNQDYILNILNLQSLSKLESLRLDFLRLNNVKNQFLEELALTLPSLCNLKHFELILPAYISEITAEGIIALSTAFKQLSKLQNLTLNLGNTESIDHKAMEILSNNITHLNLTSLQITLNEKLEKSKTTTFFQKLSSSLWESEKRLTPLFSALYGFNSLENLLLNLSGFEVCTKEFKHFSLVLKELKQLKSLSLILPQFDSRNNYEGLRRFLSSLKELHQLNSLHLIFKGATVCNKEVELIAVNLQEFSRNIEDLELRFEHVEKLKDEALEYLGSGLQGLLSLKNISLALGSCRREKVFSKEAVFNLAKKLAVLKKLENLVLNIYLTVYYSEIQEIHRYMKNHQNLKNLTNFMVNGSIWL